MTIEFDLIASAQMLRDSGVTGKLYVVPAGNDLRCFVPCNLGSCICSPSMTVEGHIVVDEHGRKKALEHANRKLEYLTEVIQDV